MDLDQIYYLHLFGLWYTGLVFKSVYLVTHYKKQGVDVYVYEKI